MNHCVLPLLMYITKIPKLTLAVLENLVDKLQNKNLTYFAITVVTGTVTLLTVGCNAVTVSITAGAVTVTVITVIVTVVFGKFMLLLEA